MKGSYRLIFALALLISIEVPNKAEIVQVGPNSFIAGIQSAEIHHSSAPEVSGRQRQENWCWAACVQMVLNFHGLYVTQEQVVQRVFGRQVDRAANNAQILRALSGWAPDRRGRFSMIMASPYIWNDATIIDDLAFKWPLIAGLQNESGLGHAYVLTAVEFHIERYVQGHYPMLTRGGWRNVPIYGERPSFDYVYLRDPWPTNDSKQKWAWADFKSQLIFLDRVHIVRL